MPERITYHDEQDVENTLKLRDVLKTLPGFCRDYFRAMEPTTSTKTRISYAYDIRVFFRFLKERNPSLRTMDIRDFPVSVLDQLEAEGGRFTIQRSKGLGENEPDMMNLTTMNPQTRRLIKVMPTDMEKTVEMFDLLLGDNLSGRKDYIAENGHLYLDVADVS